MFASVRNFVYRHRRKFIFTGLAVGGLSLLGKYAERKLMEWGENSANKIMQQQKRKTHYDRSLNTTRIMLLEFLPSIRKVIEKELDSEYLVHAIKEQPENKRKLWEELKFVGFGRTVSGIICVAFAAPVAHIMMMVLAANTLDNEADGGTSSGKIASQLVQARYMSCLQDFVEKQLPKLLKRIMSIVNRNLSSLQLTDKLTVSELESVLQKITLDITSDKNSLITDFHNECIGSHSTSSTDDNSLKTDDSSSTVCSIMPWSQHLLPPEPIHDQPSDHKTLTHLHLITADIVNTDDFCDVVNIIIQQGLNYVLDEMVDHSVFTQPSIIADNNQFSVKSKQPDIMEVDDKESMNNLDYVSDKFVPSKISSVSTQSDFNSVNCIVVKLIPVLSTMLHKILSDSSKVDLTAQNSSTFYNRLINCTQLEALSFNVYNALMFTNIGD